MMQNFNSLKERFSHLELSILPLSSVLKDNETKRLDSEYFKKEYLENEEFITQKDCVQLKNTNITIKHPTEIERNYTENENSIWFIRAQNVKPLNLDIDNKVFISTQDADKLSKNLVCKNDILMTRTGSCGDCVLYLEHDKAIASSHTFIIRNSFFNQAFLSVFFACKYGKIQINKGRYGSLQPEIAPYYLKNIYVPLFDSSFQAEIEKIVKNAHHKLEQSKSLYKEAESLLYESLGMVNSSLSSTNSTCSDFLGSASPQSENSALQNLKLKFPHLNISIKPLSKSLQKSGRLDSEYYQAKYENIEVLIKSHLCEKLGSLVNIKKSIEPGSEAYQNEGIEFVRVSNLSKFGISKSDIYLSREKFGKDLANLAPQKETILLSKDGSVGISYCVEEDLDCITSGAILHLKVEDKKQILPQVLSLILNSITTQLQAERDSGGSIIAHWKISEIKNILIPLLDSQIQGQIASKLKLSFALKKEAKELLEKAKNKVESAIENKNC